MKNFLLNNTFDMTCIFWTRIMFTFTWTMLNKFPPNKKSYILYRNSSPILITKKKLYGALCAYLYVNNVVLSISLLPVYINVEVNTMLIIKFSNVYQQCLSLSFHMIDYLVHRPVSIFRHVRAIGKVGNITRCFYRTLEGKLIIVE